MNALFPKEGFDDKVIQYAKEIASRTAPISIALAKRLTNKAGEVASDVGLEMESTAMGLLFSTEDLKEGITAFAQKRQPNFRGDEHGCIYSRLFENRVLAVSSQ